MATKKAKKTISNYRYSIKKTKDQNYVKVVCAFTYEGTRVKHNIVLPKIAGKKEEAYIEDAKAQIKTLQANDKIKDIAKEYANKHKSGNFFKRHKTPVIVCGSVLLAGAIAGASVGIYYALNQKLSQQQIDINVEKKIDEYLEIPKNQAGSPVLKEEIFKRIENVIENLSNNLVGFHADELTGDFDMTLSNSGGSAVLQGAYGAFGKSETLNDTSGFYSSNSFKSKDISNISLDASWYKNGVITENINKTRSILIEGEEQTEKSETNLILKSYKTTEESKDVYLPFYYQKLTSEGYSGLSMEGNYLYNPGIIGGSSPESEEKCIEVINNIASNITLALSKSYYFSDEYTSSILQYDDNNMYLYLPSNRSFAGSIITPYGVSVDTYRVRNYNWHFVKDSKLGWVLKSYAVDGEHLLRAISGINNSYSESIYVYQDEKGNKLSKPININKNKGYVEFNYGERKDDKKYSALTYNENLPSMTPDYDRYRLQNFVADDDGDLQPDDWNDLISRTFVKRILDKDFKGYCYDCDLDLSDYYDWHPEADSYQFAVNLTWYVTEQGEDFWRNTPHQKLVGYDENIIEGGIAAKGEEYEYKEYFEAEGSQKINLIKIEKDEGSYKYNVSVKFNEQGRVETITITKIN